MSYATLFPNLSRDARLWIYAADRPITADEQRALTDALSGFAEGWTSHGRPVHGAVDVAAGRFLLVAARLTDGDVSGCGIDASVHAVEQAGRRHGLDWLSALHVFYRTASGAVKSCARSAFRARIEAGDVTTATPVFDPTIQSVGALRGGAFEKPAGQSWHAEAFSLPEPA